MNFLPADRTANLVIWVVVWAIVLCWVVVTALSPRLPSVADVVRFGRRHWLVRWGVLGFWVWLGWHLFVRTTE